MLACLKLDFGIFHFGFRFVFMKVYIFVQPYGSTKYVDSLMS